jgi:glutamate-1-semialdehyde 2,1-aminomutase
LRTDSPGVPKGAAAGTLTAQYNDLKSVEELLEQNKDEIAAIVLEPVVGNSGFIVPSQEFLEVYPKP